MNFEKMLEYQKIDQEILALENEVNKSKERANLVSTKNNIAKSTEVIGNLKNEAAALLASYGAVQEKIDALNRLIDDEDVENARIKLEELKAEFADSLPELISAEANIRFLIDDLD